MAGYDFSAIEAKWQEYWAKNETFRQPNPGEAGFSDRPKLYVLDMFPYPSARGCTSGIRRATRPPTSSAATRG